MYHRQGREEGRGKLTHLVHFTNILQSAFAPISFAQKITNHPNCKHLKAGQSTIVQKICS